MGRTVSASVAKATTGHTSDVRKGLEGDQKSPALHAVELPLGLILTEVLLATMEGREKLPSVDEGWNSNQASCWVVVHGAGILIL